MNGLFYVSGQIGNAAELNLNYVRDSRYMSFSIWLDSVISLTLSFVFHDIFHDLIHLILRLSGSRSCISGQV